MASILDIGKNLRNRTNPIIKNILDSTDIDNRVGNYIRTGPGGRGGINRIKTELNNDWKRFTPLSMREAAVPMGRDLGRSINMPRLGQDLGYGLRGALSVTPFQRNSQALQRTAPTTSRQKTLSNIGQMATGTLLTAPMGGGKMLANVLSRVPQGAALGTGITAAGTLIGQKRLPTKNELVSGAVSGAGNSWQLAITNALTNKALSAVAPKLTQSGIDTTFKNRQFQQGVKSLFLKALAEVPAENTVFTGIDKLGDRDKRSFVAAWIQNLPGTILGNVAFAGLQSGGRLVTTPQMQKAAVVALDKTWKEWNVPVSGKINTKTGERIVQPMWKYKLQNPPVGLSVKDINEGKPVKGLLKPISDTVQPGQKLPDELTTKQKADIEGIGKTQLKEKTVGEIQRESQHPLLNEYDDALNAKNIPAMDAVIAKVRNHPDGAVREYAIQMESIGKIMVPGYEPAGIKANNSQSGFIDLGAKVGGENNKQVEHLLNYSTKLRSLGYSDDQIKVISAPEAEKILSEGIPPFSHPTFRVKNFDENLGFGVKPKQKMPQLSDEDIQQQAAIAQINTEVDPQEFKKSFASWIGKRDAAQTTATQLGSKYKGIKDNKFIEFAQEIEQTAKSNDSNITAAAASFRKDMDELFDSAKKENLDINYLKNYITHIWDKPEAEVRQMYQALKTRGFFQNDRVVPTYDEGIRMGLKPKYTNVGALVGDYARRLEQVKANYNFFKELKDKGYIVDAAVGGRNRGFKPITAEGFPRSIVQGFDGKVVEGVYYAPSEVADSINRVFGQEPITNLGKVADKTAGVSRTIQDVRLSGGVPGTPINAFSAANALKEFTSGRIVSPVTAAARSLSPQQSIKFFEQNAEQIKKMQTRNIRVSTSYDLSSLKSLKDQIQEKPLARTWDKLMSEPTFKRFMPMLQVNFFNDIEKQALKSGLDANSAADIAAKAVKNFYGSTDTANQAMRSKLTNDLASTLFFAPTFRESMINFWVNSVKALKNPTALENRQNVKFLAGAAITFGAMNYLNNQFNGVNLWDNPTYKKDKLLIPAGDITIGIPFLPSIGTLPRTAYTAGMEIAKGNVSEGSLEVTRRLMSAGLTPFFDVMANQNYFGSRIYNPKDSAGQKYADMGKHLFKENVIAHPWIKEVVDSKNQGDPAPVRISRASEMPLRFYRTDSMTQDNKKSSLSAQDELPTDKESLSILYEDANRVTSNYKENKLKTQYGLVDKKLTDYQSEFDESNALLKRIKAERPELVFDIETDLHATGGGKTTEERAKWAASILSGATSSSEAEELLAKMYSGNVLSKSVVEALNSEYGLNIGQYVSGGKLITLGGSGKKAKKATYKKASVTPFKTVKGKKIRLAKNKIPKAKITKSKGYKILTYVDKTPTVKVSKPVVRWS